MKANDCIPALFGSLVFNESVMEQYVSAEGLAGWRRCLQNGEAMSPEVADAVAEGMKNWALERGATHYTHWFQPLNGVTAEKHDSFLSPAPGGRALTVFGGKQLISGEPDASSFPSGGLRATFEARGYSAWDPTSFAFIKGTTLCIPTVFCTYDGQALDKKTPLLRSMAALDRQALRILRLLGDRDTMRVIPQVGPEQEYFLIDRAVYEQREDLKLCGRTLFGARPPRAQELDDHYFGAIRPRVAAFMQELDEELWKLGVPSKTRHNEVAPAQHELAPVYADANVANDQNQLTMELMKHLAEKHGMVCLLHEKPFAGVNGSGKHDNWSLATDRGENLFSPGKTPETNARFLLFLAAFCKGVDEYQELLRCTVAYAGNDHRLGAQEAPPAILSVFLGAELDAIIDSIVCEHAYVGQSRKPLRLGVDVLPAIPKDTTDRNRTSPVAFTGNKFEFRMLGASQSVAGPTTVLNAIMAEELRQFADELEKTRDTMGAVHALVKKAFADHRRILFSGNGYGEDWQAEAARRGLANLSCAAQALPAYVLPKNIELLTRHGIYTESEIRARHEIHMEKYGKVITIEAATLIDMIRRGILGACSAYAARLCDAAARKQAVEPPVPCRTELTVARTVAGLCDELADCTDALEAALHGVPDEPPEKQLAYYRGTVVRRMEECRRRIDRLEPLVDRRFWPYPTYTELLFSV